MAATTANVQTALLNTVPNTRAGFATLTPDTSYPTGGYAVTPAQLGLSRVSFAMCNAVGSASNNGAATASYNQATGKVQLFTTGTTGAQVEVASAANVSGITVNILALGV